MGGEIRKMIGGNLVSVHIGSLEHHSNMIAEAVKKVIKVGKVSLERL